MSDLAIKQAFPDTPNTLNTTFVDEERLKNLNKAYQKRAQEFSDNVINIPSNGQGKTIGEEQLIEMVVNRVRYQYETVERNLELPGIQLNMELIKGFAAMYKKDSGTPSDTIKLPELASVDDIVFGFVTPQVWYELAGSSGNQYNFESTGYTAGNPIGIIDNEGLGDTGSADTSLDFSTDDTWLFLTGDYVDLNADSIVTEIEAQDVDDKDYGPTPVLFSERAGDLHVLTATGHLVKQTLDIDSYAYKGGDHELVPIAFYMSSGPATTTHV